MKVAYFAPTIMAIETMPPVEFSRLFNLVEQVHQHPELDDSQNPLYSIRGGQQIHLYPNKLNIDVTWLVQLAERACQGYMDLVTKQSGAEELNLCKPVVTSIWTIRQNTGDYQEMHTHPGGNISGVIYVSVPDLDESSKPSDCQISFRLPVTKDISKFVMQDKWNFKPQAGQAVIFPSHIPHIVYPWSGEGYRTVVSFDAVLRPKDELLPPELRSE